MSSFVAFLVALDESRKIIYRKQPVDRIRTAEKLGGIRQPAPQFPRTVREKMP